MKLLVFTLVLLLSGTEAFAMNEDSMRTRVVCEAGYKFLIVWSVQGVTPTVTQIFESSNNVSLPPQPMKCDK